MLSIKIEFSNKQKTTEENIKKVFKDNTVFFTTRGIKTDANLCTVIGWKYPLTCHQFNNGNHRTMCLSQGFSVNWVDKCITGFSVTGCATHTVDSVFGNSCPLGFAVLYGTTVDEESETGIHDGLRKIQEHLTRLGMWTSEVKAQNEESGYPAGVRLTSGDRVISYLKDPSLDCVRYVYIRTQQNFINTSIVLQEYDAKRMKEVISGDVQRAIREFFTSITQDETRRYQTDNNVVRIWQVYFNQVIRTTNDYIAYNNCYPLDNTQLVLRDQLDGSIVVHTAGEVKDNQFLLAATPDEQILYVRQLARSKMAGISLGYLTTSCLNFTVSKADSKRQKEDTIMHRQRKFTFCRSDLADDNEETTKNYEQTLEYISALEQPVPLCQSTRLRPEDVYCQMPPSFADNMTDLDYIKYATRAEMKQILVHKKNLSRIICFLSIIRDKSKVYDFPLKTADVLVFDISLLTSE